MLVRVVCLQLVFSTYCDAMASPKPSYHVVWSQIKPDKQCAALLEEDRCYLLCDLEISPWSCRLTNGCRLELKIKRSTPICKAHIMAKKTFMVQWENLPKYLASLIIFVSNVYAFWLGMQLTPYMLNLRVANRLGSNKIQCSLAYKFLFMLQWLRHDVLLSIVIPGRLIWWWCKVLPDPCALSAKRCHLLPDL